MSIGFGEILMVLLISFVVVGPNDMPKVGRALAKGVKKIRTTLKDINKSFESELELEEIKEQQRELQKIRSEVENIQQEIVKQPVDIDKNTNVK